MGRDHQDSTGDGRGHSNQSVAEDNSGGANGERCVQCGVQCAAYLLRSARSKDLIEIEIVRIASLWKGQPNGSAVASALHGRRRNLFVGTATAATAAAAEAAAHSVVREGRSHARDDADVPFQFLNLVMHATPQHFHFLCLFHHFGELPLSH
jgi:hypothetical protein